MLPPLGHPLYFGFAILTGLTLVGFYAATGKRLWVLIAGACWLLATAGLAATGFFTVTDTVPPRVALVVLPVLVGGLYVGFSERARSFRAGVDVEILHYLHTVRIAVEVYFLHGLYASGVVAKALTYEGLNYDVIPGLLLPVIGLLVFRWRKLSVGWAVAANVAGILVLAWTVVVAVLSAPTSYQLLSLDQPTVAIFYFPWIWLPALVAPLMFWAHFLVLGRLRDDPAFSWTSPAPATAPKNR
ncbi:hypothetical protein [Neolewinella antarctica]|uniref:Uncharacterized protein n=1 Tax=Neolewinella antarctica TaxID=442734 RepID=A0ABX0XFC5_9BACT|nr:hypothetical protein [Neolewinella antarctica]NJC27591.1 hypothetical protein [Neolewinella antarctica]